MRPDAVVDPGGRDYSARVIFVHPSTPPGIREMLAAQHDCRVVESQFVSEGSAVTVEDPRSHDRGWYPGQRAML